MEEEQRKGGRGKAFYDWRTLEESFVKGDCKILELSREKTGLDSSPTYSRLRKMASKHRWYEKRKEYQASQALLPVTEEEKKAALELRQNAEKLVDAAAVIEEHLKLSRTLKSMYGALGVKVRAAIDSLEPGALTPSQILNAVNTLTSVLQAATELERKSLNLAEPLQQVEVTTRYVVSLDPIGEPKDPEEELRRTLSLDEWAAAYANN